jgi:hypothetical protein
MVLAPKNQQTRLPVFADSVGRDAKAENAQALCGSANLTIILFSIPLVFQSASAANRFAAHQSTNLSVLMRTHRT